MKSLEKVSIITVTFNAVDTIEQTIESVLGQTYNNIEYIIVDGMSTDGTFEKICKYKNKISKIMHEFDNGLYDAMNKGISCATGQVIGIINGDDWLEKDAVANVVNALDDSADILYGKINRCRYDGSIKGSETVKIDDIWYRMIPHPAVFVKKKIYDLYGTFNLSYSLSGDYELILRFYNEGVRFKYLDKILANFREGGLSTRRRIDGVKEAKKIWMQYSDKCPNKSKYLQLINDSYNCAKMAEVYEQSNEKFKIRLNSLFYEDIENVIVFGAGVWGRRCAEKLRGCNISCSYFADNNSEKQGTRIDNIEVISPERLLNMKCSVIIALGAGYDEICEQLKKMKNSNLKWIKMFDLYEDKYS